MFKLRRIALLWILLIGSALVAQAAHRRPLTTPETEARNEVFEPSLSGQIREARRITYFLAEALTLSPAQRHAVEAFTQAEHQALALAATAEQAAQTRQEYRLAVQHLLDTSQLTTYVALCQRLAGTAQALDGTGLAVR